MGFDWPNQYDVFFSGANGMISSKASAFGISSTTIASNSSTKASSNLYAHTRIHTHTLTLILTPLIQCVTMVEGYKL